MFCRNGVFLEGGGGVKWQLGFPIFWARKMGLTALAVGSNHWEWVGDFKN